MISFCHGQEHHATHHKHILVLASSIEHGRKIFDDRDAGSIEFGKQISLEIQPYQCTLWIISPDFTEASVIRRLIRSIDGLILVYYNSNIDAIEEWMNKYSVEQSDILTLVEDFTVLELMNTFHGKLSNFSTWKKALKTIL